MKELPDQSSFARHRRRTAGGKTRRRSERAHAAIYRAALAGLDAEGYGRLSIESIAARAGAGKATIYRWWPSKAALILDAYVHTHARQVAVPVGPFEAALARFLADTCRRLRTTSDGPAMAALMAEAQRDAAFGAMFRRRWIAARRGVLGQLLQRGVREGRLRRGLDLEVVLDMLYGPIWYRLLNRHAPLDRVFARRLWAQVRRGIAGDA